MKKHFVMVFSVMFACIALALAGCGQDESSTGSAKSMEGNMQSSQSGVRVAVIDVGKGDCILIQVGSSSALIDTGYSDTSNEVLAYLRNQGVSHLDCLIITHYDKDHVGGIRSIGNAIDIDKAYLPGYQGADKHYRNARAAVDDLGLATQLVTEEQSFMLGGANVSILPSSVTYNPHAGDEGNDNDLSLVTTLTFQNDSYLFTGDLEDEGIDDYLERGRGRFDVLKVPHHGEKSHSTEALLASVQPKVAMITDGADEPADKKTLKLLQNSGADTYRTSTNGTIVVQSTGTGAYSVTTDTGFGR